MDDTPRLYLADTEPELTMLVADSSHDIINSYDTKHPTVSAYDARDESTSQFLSRLPLERVVVWGVNWKTPVRMIGLLIVGRAVALGHHFYYRFLDGRIVSSRDSDSNWSNPESQEWQLRYGTAFAFTAKTCMAAAVSVVYQQHLWTTVSTKSISISGLIAAFGAISDPFAFFNPSFLSHVKVDAVLAALTW